MRIWIAHWELCNVQGRNERQLQLKWPFLDEEGATLLPLPPSFPSPVSCIFRQAFSNTIFQLQSQIATFSFCTHRHVYVHVYMYYMYICSCCCCQLLPLLPEFLKRFAYFINRKCSLRATDKNNCYCHCRFSLSLLQVPPFPSAASDCSFNFSSDSNWSSSSSSSSPGPSWSLIPGGRRCSFYCSIAKYS